MTSVRAIPALALLLCSSAVLRVAAVRGEYYVVSRPAAQFADISSSGARAAIPSSDNCVSVSLGLPKALPFFASSYTTAFVCENGLVSFGEAATAYDNECPMAFPKKVTTKTAAAVLWTDLDALNARFPSSSVTYQTFSPLCPVVTSSGACFIVQYTNLPYDSQDASDYNTSGTFQAVFYAGGDVLMQYRTVGASLAYTVGLKSNVVLQDYVMALCDPSSASAGVQANSAILFHYNATKALCGDATCDSSLGETCSSCPTDCGACCGNGACDTALGENCKNCPSDCSKPCCGDGICGLVSGANETSCSCPSDCTGACCGDGVCASSENCSSCFKDCKPPCSILQYPIYQSGVNTRNLWRDLQPDGTKLALGDDDATSSPVALGFAFPFFYQRSVRQLYIGSNGVLSYSAPIKSVASKQCPYLDVAPNYIIAPLWADLNPNYTNAAVYYKSFAQCDLFPTEDVGCFIVQYNNVPLKGASSVAATFEVILMQSGTIYFAYQYVSSDLNILANVGIKGGGTANEGYLNFQLFGCGGYGNVSKITSSSSQETLHYVFSGCGDGVCDSAKSEDCVSCPSDCPNKPCGKCGDDECNSTVGESCQTCTRDCGLPNTDSDGDGVPDCSDACPYNGNKTVRTICGCGSDIDTDGDKVPDCKDVCPTQPNKTTSPGICGCQYTDKDTDGDGSPDCIDMCITNKFKVLPLLCGCWVNETDTDKDGTPDCLDKCPKDPFKTAPGKCNCGIPDTDADGDGFPLCEDACDNDPLKTAPGICGCGTPDIDSDGDGIMDCDDPCPYKANYTPGVCGCSGGEEIDTDGDGYPNCIDKCPTDPKKVAPGKCGCGSLDTDSDSDGTPDCNDLCPFNPLKVLPGVCTCSTDDVDSDGDGTFDCEDKCPTDPTKTVPGKCGCGKSETLDKVDSDGDGFPDCVDACPYNATLHTDLDSDSDGIPNCMDKCPLDKAKSAPLFCGCGAVDPSSTVGKTQATSYFAARRTVRDLVCKDSTDAYIGATVSGGTAPYNFSLYKLGVQTVSSVTVVTTHSFTNVTEGIYLLSVHDYNGCSVTWSLITITVPPLMVITAETVQQEKCGTTATLLMVVDGGVTPYKYKLLGAGYSQTAGTFTDIPSGQYVIRATDARGCTKSSALHSISSPNSTVCGSGSSVHVSGSLQALFLVVIALIAASS
eukprot:m51a1_g9988 putative domain protein (1173) ;mRNA; f:31566-35895